MLTDKLDPHGLYTVEHWRAGVKIADYEFPNYITVEGRKLLLNLMFASAVAGVTPLTTWRMGLVDGATSPVYAQTDSYTAIGSLGWNENTAYTDDANTASSPAPVTGQTRPAWVATAATGNTTQAQITNSATSVFDITASGTVAGLFIVAGPVATTGSGTGVNMKSDHVAGTLWSAATFTSGNVAVQNGDQLKVTYTVTA